MQDVRCAPRPARLSLYGRRSSPRSKVEQKGRESAAARGLILTLLGQRPWRQTPAFPSFFQATAPSSVIECGSSFLVPCFTKAIKLFLDMPRDRDLSGQRAERMLPPPAKRRQRRVYFRRGPPPGTSIYKKGLKYCSSISESIGEPCRIAICSTLGFGPPWTAWARGGSWACLALEGWEKHRNAPKARVAVRQY